MFRKDINSIAILDLFNLIPMDFQLYRLTSSKNIFNFKIIIINKIYGFLAIYKYFNTIIPNFYSISLLLFDMIFNHPVRIFKNLSVAKINKIWGGEK